MRLGTDGQTDGRTPDRCFMFSAGHGHGQRNNEASHGTFRTPTLSSGAETIRLPRAKECGPPDGANANHCNKYVDELGN